MSSACECSAFGSAFAVRLGKRLELLYEHTLLCDLRDQPVLFSVGERVRDLKGHVVTIRKFGVIVETRERTAAGKVKERAILRGAVCHSKGGWLRFLPLIQLEKVEDDSEDEETDGDSEDTFV